MGTQSSPTTGVGLFGNTQNANNTGGLFGTAQSSTTMNGAGLFGSNRPTGGLFGSSGLSSNVQNNTTNSYNSLGQQTNPESELARFKRAPIKDLIQAHGGDNSQIAQLIKGIVHFLDEIDSKSFMTIRSAHREISNAMTDLTKKFRILRNNATDLRNDTDALRQAVDSELISTVQSSVLQGSILSNQIQKGALVGTELEKGGQLTNGFSVSMSSQIMQIPSPLYADLLADYARRVLKLEDAKLALNKSIEEFEKEVNNPHISPFKLIIQLLQTHAERYQICTAKEREISDGISLINRWLKNSTSHS